jgi:putative FmdB family regulatory protein
MPVYEYLCEECGPFTEIRLMSEFEQPCECPQCSTAAPRVLLTAPNFSCVGAGERKARSINERSAHAPQTLDQYKASHPAGCGCCSGKPSRLVAKTASGAKSFPTARPWMISH